MTASARKKFLLASFVIGAVITVIGVVSMQQDHKQKLSINDKTFNLEVLTSNESRQLGLSGRSSIGQDDAVLFVFDRQQMRCFWMKDMKFDIDMVWLDADKKVTAIEHRVKPSTYPIDFCHNGQYVLEWQAGTARAIELGVGTQIAF